ncbi:MAG: helix-turn-helix domain-containing protein [Bacteroidales bacterium]|nr:helix-turn-helix domain-containing protein [Bacteroidales bacterium]
MTQKAKPFGQVLRERRLEKGFTLRKFADLMDISPTYLSQVEQCNVDPPTAERIKQMAEALDVNPDEWIVLADRLPNDLPGIIKQQPSVFPDLLREASGLTIEQLRKLKDQARKMREKNQSEEGEGEKQ